MPNQKNTGHPLVEELRVEKAFEEFWESERSEQLKEMTEREDITQEQVENLIGKYLYTGRLPQEQEIADSLTETPRILERKKVVDRSEPGLRLVAVGSSSPTTQSC